MEQTESTINDSTLGGRGSASGEGCSNEHERLHFSWGRRLPLIRQSEASECGLACLAMIMGYYGHSIDLPSMRMRFSLSLMGMNLAQLIDIAQSLGLSCRPLRLELHELSQLQTPCILHWDLDHFVVLRKVHKNYVVIHDPAIGERRLRLAEVGKHLTGIAVEVSKGPTFQRKEAPPPVSLRVLAGTIQGLGRSLVVILGLALVLELIGLLWPQFLQMVVDQVLADDDHDLLTFLGLSYLFLILIQTCVSTMRTWTVLWLSTHFNLSWSGNVFQHLLRLPQTYFLKRHLGDIVSRFGAVATIQQTLTTQFVSVVLDGVMASLTFVVMLFYSPLLSGLTAVALLLHAVSRVLYYRAYFESNLSQITVTAKQQSCFMESVRGVQTLRLHNQVGAQTSRYLNVTADALNTSIGVQRLNMLFGAVDSLATGAQRVAVLWFGAWLALGGQFSAGMLMAFVAYADQFASRGGSLIDYIVQLKLLRLQGERLADIVLTPTEAHTDGTRVGPEPEPSIRFDRVSFRYGDGEPWVIKDCSFEIKAGESVALTGASGCGKSTLVRLMLGLLDPQQGTIFIGGIDLKHLGKHAYRRMVGSVMQDDTLFAGTIADNISFREETATSQRIVDAASAAALHEDIAAMPMGYQTMVGDMGSALSGGQKQRLFLARAIYKQPRLLVLDEATSHLDTPCEQRINAALAAMKSTRIVVAHRAQTIEAAGNILICASGAVRQLKRPDSNAATGNRNDVCATNSLHQAG